MWTDTARLELSDGPHMAALQLLIHTYLNIRNGTTQRYLDSEMQDQGTRTNQLNALYHGKRLNFD